jgi:hypothetical protein
MANSVRASRAASQATELPQPCGPSGISACSSDLPHPTGRNIAGIEQGCVAYLSVGRTLAERS